MLIFQIIITFVLLGMAFDILTKPGELLQGYVRTFNESYLPEWFIKLMTCPYCLVGNMCFWVTLAISITKNDYQYLICVPVVIILVFHYTQSNKIK